MKTIRAINIDDFNKNYIQLMNQLSNTIVTKNQFIKYIKTLSDNHQIYVLEKNSIIIGSITIIIEPKLIHQLKNVCHIEDLIIDKNYRRQGLSKELLMYAKNIAKNNNCYKIILNCNESLKKFYSKNKFYKSSLQMRFNI